MPRPQRIEYENALYHVMNRGRARQTIFHDEYYYQAFLDTLEEAHGRFGCVIHAYCLMGNHYHLLLETPNANLSRVMRHINGVYTQRHNRLKHTDGPLFRGRYKAVLVDGDAYLLQLSRYIHRNPVDGKRPLVTDLADYPWSSYPAYIGKMKAPSWLCREITYQMLGQKQRYRGYATYVMQGVDEQTARWYRRGNMAAIVGDKEFKSWVYDELLVELEAEERARVIHPVLSMEAIVTGVADAWDTTPERLTAVVKGPWKGSDARKVAMYLCQELADARLRDIAQLFNLGHAGSVSFVTHQVRKRRREDPVFAALIEGVIKSIVQSAG